MTQSHTRSSTSPPAVDSPAPTRAPKGPQDAVGNQAVAERTSANGQGAPAALPEAGLGEDQSYPYVVLGRGAAADKPGVQLGHARVSTLAALWGLDLGVDEVRLAREGDAPVVELRWPPGWGRAPTVEPQGRSLQPIEARLAVNTARGSKGWPKVKEGRAVEALLGGESNEMSKAAQSSMRGIVATGDFARRSDADQATFLDGLLTSDAGRTGVVAEPVATRKAAVRRAGPTVEKDHDFVGKKADASVYTLSFDGGRTLKVYLPATTDPKTQTFTIDEIEDAVARLPAASRDVAEDVTMNPVVNPEDAYWAATYNSPDFHSFMTADAAGHITIYPSVDGTKESQDYASGTMIHETGHTWGYKRWGTDTTKGGWLAWRAAMAKDVASPSGYATQDITEDLAETIQVYGSTRGAPAFQEYKAILPNRFAILDAEMK